MAGFCIPPDLANTIKEGFRSGKITLEKLYNSTTEENHKLFSQFTDEATAKQINTELEKAFASTQQSALSKFLKKITTGEAAKVPQEFQALTEVASTAQNVTDFTNKLKELISTGTPEQQKAILAFTDQLSKPNGMTAKQLFDQSQVGDLAFKKGKSLIPTMIKGESGDKFLQDLAEQRLGKQVTAEETGKIIELTNQLAGITDKKSRQYFDVLKELNAYVVKQGGETKSLLADIAGVPRAIQATADLSATFRQGRAYFGTKEWTGAFKRQFSYAKSQAAIDELEYQMFQNKHWDVIEKVKNDLGLTLFGEGLSQQEEQFIGKNLPKVPLIGQSERAYVGFLNDLRFNRFANELDRLEAAGNPAAHDLEAQRELARVISAATGRGNLGAFDKAGQKLSILFFSPRWIKSRVDMVVNSLNPHISSVARSEAQKALGRTLATSAGVLGLAKMAGLGVELDPRSSDFGKVKVGNTRFDVTGGLAPYLVLVVKAASQSSKSTTTNKVSKLGSGDYGSQTWLDVLTSFIENKSSPLAGLVVDYMKGQDFNGNKIPKTLADLSDPKKVKNLENIVKGLFIPLIGQDTVQAYKDSGGSLPLTGAAAAGSFFGAGVSTYGGTKDDLQNNLGVNNADPKLIKELDRLKTTGNGATLSDVSGQKEFKLLQDQKGSAAVDKALTTYAQLYVDKAARLINTNLYQNASDENKKKLLDSLRSREVTRVFNQMEFKVKEPKTKKAPSLPSGY